MERIYLGRKLYEKGLRNHIVEDKIHLYTETMSEFSKCAQMLMR